MTIQARAINPQLSASVDRLANEILTEGILDPADSFVVREQAPPDMSVEVGSGTAGDLAVVDASSDFESPYICRHADATTTVPIAVGDASNDRIDLVVLRVYDDDVDSSGTTEAVLEVVEGTPASTPAAPAVPDGAATLAEVLVAAGESTSIVDGDITDRRVSCQVRAAGADAVADADLVPFSHMRGYVEQTAPTLIERRVSSAASETFTVPAGVNGVMLTVSRRHDGTGLVSVNITLNGDATANYDYELLLADNGTVTSAGNSGASSAAIGWLGAGAGNGGAISVIMPHAGRSLRQFWTSAGFASNGPNRRMFSGGGGYDVVAAVSSITVEMSAGSFQAAELALFRLP